MPCLPVVRAARAETGMIGEIFAGHLRKVSPGSARHLALVEAVRRLYKQAAMAAGRADKTSRKPVTTRLAANSEFLERFHAMRGL